jgi:hypothetical protein
MFVNGEWILFVRVSLRPALASHLTLEFTVIAPCREIPSLVPFPSQPMSTSSNETHSSSAQALLDASTLPTTDVSGKAWRPHSPLTRGSVNGERLDEIFSISGPLMWSIGQSFWLQIQRTRVRFPALPNFMSRGGVWNGVHSASWGQLRIYLNAIIAAAV